MKIQSKYNIILIFLLVVVISFFIYQKQSIKEGSITRDVKTFTMYLETMRKLKSNAMHGLSKPDP